MEIRCRVVLKRCVNVIDRDAKETFTDLLWSIPYRNHRGAISLGLIRLPHLFFEILQISDSVVKIDFPARRVHS